MRVVGDIHGDFGTLFRIAVLEPLPNNVIQVGDFGLGFGSDPQNIPDNIRFIRGNHDNLKICRKYPNWIADGAVEETPYGPMMFIGGAYSVDVAYRTAGKNWWGDEELSVEEFEQLIEKYTEIQPAIMVTHDCPDGIGREMFDYSVNEFRPSRTNLALRRMFNRHQPHLWVFGHHHQNVDKKIAGTRFICLGINSYIDINLEGTTDDTNETKEDKGSA